MLFQGPSILKFSCAHGASNQPHLFRHLEYGYALHYCNIRNYTKYCEEFCSENIPSYSEIFQLHSHTPP